MNNRTIEKRKIADGCELWLLWDDQNLVNACYLYSSRIKFDFFEKKFANLSFSSVNNNVENNNNVLGDIFEL